MGELCSFLLGFFLGGLMVFSLCLFAFSYICFTPWILLMQRAHCGETQKTLPVHCLAFQGPRLWLPRAQIWHGWGNFRCKYTINQCVLSCSMMSWGVHASATIVTQPHRSDIQPASSFIYLWSCTNNYTFPHPAVQTLAPTLDLLFNTTSTQVGDLALKHSLNNPHT